MKKKKQVIFECKKRDRTTQETNEKKRLKIWNFSEKISENFPDFFFQNQEFARITNFEIMKCEDPLYKTLYFKKVFENELNGHFRPLCIVDLGNICSKIQNISKY